MFSPGDGMPPGGERGGFASKSGNKRGILKTAPVQQENAFERLAAMAGCGMLLARFSGIRQSRGVRSVSRR